MRLYSNLHTHTQFDDAQVDAEEQVKKAIAEGFVSLGFSGHSVLDFDSGYAMTDEQVYIEHIRYLQEKYQGKIEIILGVELDRDTPVRRPEYRYAIGSVHQIRSKERIYSVDLTREETLLCIKEMFDGDPLLYATHYYDLVVSSALRQEVDVVGHFDLLRRYADDIFCGEDYDRIAKNAIERIFVQRKDIIFELNTGGMYRGKLTEPYPRIELLSYLQSLGGRVTVTTDSHDIKGLTFWEEEAMSLLLSLGFKEVWRIRKSGFEPVSLTEAL